MSLGTTFRYFINGNCVPLETIERLLLAKKLSWRFLQLQLLLMLDIYEDRYSIVLWIGIQSNSFRISFVRKYRKVELEIFFKNYYYRIATKEDLKIQMLTLCTRFN